MHRSRLAWCRCRRTQRSWDQTTACEGDKKATTLFVYECFWSGPSSSPKLLQQDGLLLALKASRTIKPLPSQEARSGTRGLTSELPRGNRAIWDQLVCIPHLTDQYCSRKWNKRPLKGPQLKPLMGWLPPVAEPAFVAWREHTAH